MFQVPPGAYDAGGKPLPQSWTFTAEFQGGKPPSSVALGVSKSCPPPLTTCAMGASAAALPKNVLLEGETWFVAVDSIGGVQPLTVKLTACKG